MAHRRLNIKLLRRAESLILQNPQNFDVDHDPYFGVEGWVITAAGQDVNRVDNEGDIYLEARKLLRITAAEADSLFLGSNWPRDFINNYQVDPSSMKDFKINAQLAAARIEHFIEKGA